MVDDENRENEGDLIMAAEKVRPEDINYMATHGRGLICLTMSRERCAQLRLPLMVTDTDQHHATNFTISIEAAEGITTGISAHDRARTIQAKVAKGRAVCRIEVEMPAPTAPSAGTPRCPKIRAQLAATLTALAEIRAMSVLAAVVLPALNPNHPTQSIAVPVTVIGRLWGGVGSIRLPTMIQATSAATPHKPSRPVDTLSCCSASRRSERHSNLRLRMNRSMTLDPMSSDGLGGIGPLGSSDNLSTLVR